MAQYVISEFSGGSNQGLQVASNPGRIYYSTTTQSAGHNIKPPTPCTNIPFKKDPDLVVRGSIPDQIHRKCALATSRTALVGLGGVGKSQLAIEYGYRYREQHPDRWVFWVFAGSPARFEQDFRKIANLVQIPERDDPEADILTLVHDWLHDSRNGEWLVILDNADDAQIFPKPRRASQETEAKDQSGQPPSCYLPQTENGRILMTTRYKDIAIQFVEQRDIIAIEPMDESDALELLEKKLEGLTDRDSDGTRKELVAALEYMPLAIAQAAAYIFHRAPSLRVHKYLEQFRKSDSERIKLLERQEREGGHLRRDWEAKNSILITWQISFEHLLQIRPSAADRLSLMSFFDRQGIPKILIREQARAKAAILSTADDDVDTQRESVSHSASGSSGDDDFEEDMVTLRDYSLVTFDGEESYEMHALVQLATRKWLAEDKLDTFRRQFFKILIRQFEIEKKNAHPKRFHILYPHVKAALSQRSEAEFSSTAAQVLRDFSTLMENASHLTMLSTYNLDDAENLLKTALEVRIKVLGMNNMNTLENRMDTMSTMRFLELIYSNQRRWSKARPLVFAALKWGQDGLGLKHLTTLGLMESLAQIHQAEGNLMEAEAILHWVFNAMKETDAPIRPVLRLLVSFAKLRGKQGNMEQAFNLHQLVVRKAEEEFGPLDNFTLGRMMEMSRTLQELGRLDEAIDLQVQVVEHFEQNGTLHLDALFRRYELYQMYFDQGLVEKGLKNLTNLLPAVTKEYGQQYYLTVMIMSRISLAWMDLGRFDEAEKMASQTLEVCGRGSSAEREMGQQAMETLVHALRLQGRDTRAKKVVLQLLEERKKLFGPDHPHTVKAMDLLASIQKGLESQKEAEGSQ